MRLISLSLSNFFTFKEVDLEFEDGQAYFIEGRNTDLASCDSNGAGKSMLFESIFWILYEKLIRDGFKVKDSIGSFDSKAKGVLTFERYGNIYRVERGRGFSKHDTYFRLFCNGADMTQHKDNVAFLQDVLGCPWTVLTQAAYVSSQNDYTPLAKMSASELRSFVTDVLNLDRFDGYLDRLKELGKSASSEAMLQEKDKANQTATILSLENQLAQFNDLRDGFEAAKEERIVELKAQARVLKLKLKESSPEELEAKCEELRAKIEEMSQYRQEHENVAVELAKAEDAFLNGSNRRLKLAQILSSKEVEYRSVKDSHDNLYNNDSGECAYCGSALSSHTDLTARMKAIQEQLDEISLDRDKAEANLASHDVRLSETKDKVESYRALRANLEPFRQTLMDYRSELALVERELSEVESINQQLLEIEEKMEKARSTSPEKIDAFILETEASLLEARESLSETLEQLEATTTRMECVKLLTDAVRASKVGLYNSFVQDFEIHTNKMFAAFTGGDFLCELKDKKGELQLQFTSSEKDGIFYPFSVFSQGERVRIIYAMQFAMSLRYGINFMIDDESLNALDKSGIKYILERLTSMPSTYFFISHNDTLRDMFESYKTILVSKSNNTSTVTIL